MSSSATTIGQQKIVCMTTCAALHIYCQYNYLMENFTIKSKCGNAMLYD